MFPGKEDILLQDTTRVTLKQTTNTELSGDNGTWEEIIASKHLR